MYKKIMPLVTHSEGKLCV